jgi:hypothetical protein
MSPYQELLVRVKEGYDGPTPSGNAVAALTLLRLSEFTGREDFRSKAEGTLKAFADSMESSPHSHTYMLCALDFWFGAKEMVVAGSRGDGGTWEMIREIQKRFLPSKVLVLASERIPETQALREGKSEIDGRAAVYICENFACKSPITELSALREQLGVTPG